MGAKTASIDILGCKISIACDFINGENWVNIRDANDKLIMSVQKKLWNGQQIVGFTPQIRDLIINAIERLYG